MAKYDYVNLRGQLAMLAGNSGETSIEKLRVFYPKAGWTELIGAVQSLTASDNTVTYNPKNHAITINQ